MEAHLRARRLLVQTPTNETPGPALAPVHPIIREARPTYQPSEPAGPFGSLNANVIMILSVLLCGLVSALVLHAIVRCIFRIARRACYGPDALGPARPSEAAPAKKEGLRTLPTLVYSAGLGLGIAGSGSECAICLAEFRHGEFMRVLPRCNHGFHVRCIDRWLRARPTCPTCRQALFGKLVRPDAVGPASQPEMGVGVTAGTGQARTDRVGGP